MRIINVKRENEQKHVETPQLLANSEYSQLKKSTFYNFGEQQDVAIITDPTCKPSQFADNLFKNYLSD